ncbi:Hypothetical predicted protein [Cloeon dipterum]|nr:Hypothetical predicted protein [Cloeon dipterum]
MSVVQTRVRDQNCAGNSNSASTSLPTQAAVKRGGMHCAVLEGDDAEPHEVFAALGVLVLEGRVPGATDRGYGEGPHCPPLGAKPRPAVLPHQCDPNTNILCRRELEFRKRISLLWQSGIPMKLEVLVCPDCACGAQRASCSEPSVKPSPSDLLLEQWTISAQPDISGDEVGCGMGVRALLQAVRSQLFFSQLGAWLSSSEGRFPRHICYRLTVPGEPFTSHFQRQPVEHSFPEVKIGRPNNRVTFQVSLRSLPRGESGVLPSLLCVHKQDEICSSAAPTINSTTTNTANDLKNNELLFPINNSGVKRKNSVEEKGAGPLLGASLLDPPRERRRGAVGQFQTPSLETPDHLLFRPTPVETPKEKDRSHHRTSRHNRVRRRDSLKASVLDDRMHVGCNKAGKHHCCTEDEGTTRKEESASKVQDTEKLSKEQLTEGQKAETKVGSKLNLSPQEVGEVLAVMQYWVRPVTQPHKDQLKDHLGEKTLAANMVALVTPPSLPKSFLEKGAKTKQPLENGRMVDKADKLMAAILRSSQENGIAFQAQAKPTGLERIKHMFNKTVTISGKETGVAAEFQKSSHVTYNLIKYPLKIPSGVKIPSAMDKARFRQSLDSAASMVFRSGLPLTSSPAPVRRGTCFDFDSSLNSVQAIKGALFDSQSLSSPACTDEDSCTASPDVETPPSPFTTCQHPKLSWSPTSGSLLGSFEESVLNGRLEPVSTVHGFTAELGASGSFCPKHLNLPVTVFFYTLGDNDKVSTPYLGHINLGKKGYSVPRSGTIQVTLFNPLGTVVKMFVVAYDLSDMPPCSQTFLRQRTLYLPSQENNADGQMQPSNLRYLIHLRFSSSKSGRVFLHSDIRMIIFRKSDQDTATAHCEEEGESAAHELRSFISGPTNPKFSPRK